MSRRPRAAQAGQALPLTLGVATVLLFGVVGLFVLGRAQLAVARA